mmetsp:Transcript_13316/g.39515  ORF Transcript_13316/g.39515 Transcript_13316/m.39515 type:complete len:374 (-) Transcript_13316:544-1665(-)
MRTGSGTASPCGSQLLPQCQTEPSIPRARVALSAQVSERASCMREKGSSRGTLLPPAMPDTSGEPHAYTTTSGFQEGSVATERHRLHTSARLRRQWKGSSEKTWCSTSWSSAASPPDLKGMKASKPLVFATSFDDGSHTVCDTRRRTCRASASSSAAATAASRWSPRATAASSAARIFRVAASGRRSRRFESASESADETRASRRRAVSRSSLHSWMACPAAAFTSTPPCRTLAMICGSRSCAAGSSACSFSASVAISRDTTAFASDHASTTSRAALSTSPSGTGGSCSPKMGCALTATSLTSAAIASRAASPPKEDQPGSSARRAAARCSASRACRCAHSRACLALCMATAVATSCPPSTAATAAASVPASS